jgi:HD-GYP domain-containing protein (c-di-GMP phosphodiesterase class II)
MLLRSAAKIIKGACRAEDIIARWGGDEFIILLPQTSNRELQKICSRITNQCALYEDMSFPVKISISLGCASKEQMEQNLETMLKRAEDLMYKNKLFESINLRNVIVNSIKKTLYEKSHETESHVERLKELCRLIGIGMGLSDTNLAELDLLSVLHDLGKIAIKNSILNKPVRLTTDEWREMRRHPEIGYRIAQSSPELFHIAEYILSHHERWDSRGYPRGLKGEDIPLLSRIFAVADAYDSMTNERPYRKPLTNQEAVDVILKNSGTQFDPGIVRVFVTELLISKRIGKIS